MADVFTRRKRSEVMARIQSRGNKQTEVALLKIFRFHKITGWRRHLPLPGRPDFTFRKLRLAVFVDGCFWHGCSKHFRMPESNRRYWRSKIARNKTRDKLVNQTLHRLSWRVLRIWEHELRRKWQLRLVGRLRRSLQ